MDVKSYLIQNGATEEDALTIANNPTLASAWTKLASEAEEGKTAFLKAQETKEALEKWNQDQVVPYVRKADEALAAERAKIAGMQAHMRTLKEAGYEIPDAYLEGTPAVPSPSNNPASPATNGKDYDDLIYKGQLTNLELISISNRHRALTGTELDPMEEYNEFKTKARPGENLRTYVARKYQHDDIAAKKESEKKAAYEAQLREEGRKAATEELMKKYGSNPETVVPRASRFDHISEERKANGDRDSNGNPLWATKAGRAELQQRRLQKYAGTIQ